MLDKYVVYEMYRPMRNKTYSNVYVILPYANATQNNLSSAPVFC